jgi:hypothetical protein
MAIGVAGAAGYRILRHEQHLARTTASTRAGQYAAESAIATISEIKAALHAYVAPGQGHDFWMARASMLMAKLRGTNAELAHAAASSGLPLTDELDRSDRLAALEKRARTHANAGQMLLAGEVIFTEARDELDTMRLAVVSTREALAQAADRQNAELRREEIVLALGATAVMVLGILVLVPPGRAPAIPAPAASASAGDASDAGYGGTAIAASRRPKVRVGSIAPADDSASAARESSNANDGDSSPKRPATDSGQPEALEGRRDGREDAPGLRLSDAAAVCTDLGRVSQTNEIEALLGRAARVLSASGVIVWVASENRDELLPAASSGYDERLFERIGSIRRDAANLTAAAFRAGTPRTSVGGTAAPAALAVPLLTPHGSVGVLSAELRDVVAIDSDRLALAAIFAAQLANLLGSMGPPIESVGEVQAQNG